MRSIHERLFFRPLLEAFTARRTAERPGRPGRAGRLDERAVAERLAAFGSATPTAPARPCSELTRGFTRSSRLMQQLLPAAARLAVEAPTPTSACSGCAPWPPGQHRRDQLVALFRESPAGGPPAVPAARHQPAGRPRPRAPPRAARRPGRRPGRWRARTRRRAGRRGPTGRWPGAAAPTERRFGAEPAAQRRVAAHRRRRRARPGRRGRDRSGA